MIHLAVGYKLLGLCPDIEDAGAFLLGTISPDAIMFRPGCERSDKSKTHFCVGNEGWGYYTNYDEWLKNLKNNITALSGTVNKDFLFGYLSHIITDIENTRSFWTPARLTCDENYIKSFVRDCMEIDSLLLNANPNISELWSMLERSNKHCISGLFAVEDNSALIERMKSEMYYDRYPDPEYTPAVFTMAKVSRFMDDVVNKVMINRQHP